MFTVDCIGELDCLDLGMFSLAVYLGFLKQRFFSLIVTIKGTNMPTLAWNEKAHLKWATPKMGNALQIQDVARGFWQ